MSIYTISSFSFGDGVIDFSDPKSRLSSFFIWNEGDGKFLTYTKPKGKSQNSFLQNKVKTTDYFPANIGIPIFSQRAKYIFESRMSAEVTFYECTVEGINEILFLCKTNRYLDIIDEKKTIFRTFVDGFKLIDVPAYQCDVDFFIARDNVFRERMVVSQKFVDICKSENLNIDFINCNSA